MVRVLVLLEEYNELLFLEAFLKKLGFDTLGLQRTALLDRKLLGFSPPAFDHSGARQALDGHANP